jgi:hypothetical protein
MNPEKLRDVNGLANKIPLSTGYARLEKRQTLRFSFYTFCRGFQFEPVSETYQHFDDRVSHRLLTNGINEFFVNLDHVQGNILNA